MVIREGVLQNLCRCYKNGGCFGRGTPPAETTEIMSSGELMTVVSFRFKQTLHITQRLYSQVLETRRSLERSNLWFQIKFKILDGATVFLLGTVWVLVEELEEHCRLKNVFAYMIHQNSNLKLSPPTLPCSVPPIPLPLPSPAGEVTCDIWPRPFT